jgi:hypothetical protein
MIVGATNNPNDVYHLIEETNSDTRSAGGRLNVERATRELPDPKFVDHCTSLEKGSELLEDSLGLRCL